MAVEEQTVREVVRNQTVQLASEGYKFEVRIQIELDQYGEVAVLGGQCAIFFDELQIAGPISVQNGLAFLDLANRVVEQRFADR